MIYGVVNLRREATLPLVVGNANKQQQMVDTVIDTGFNCMVIDYRLMQLRAVALRLKLCRMRIDRILSLVNNAIT